MDIKNGTQVNDCSSIIKTLVRIFCVFSICLAVLYLATSYLPGLSQEELKCIKLPSNLKEAQKLGNILSKYKDTHYYKVLFGLFFVYIFLQTFIIPGSIFLSILCGFLYPMKMALPIVCVCSAIGATGCYIISMLVGRPLIDRYLLERVNNWRKTVDNQRENLFFYILFLRITPFLPNWFVNMVSPVVDIPISTFFWGTMFGVAPLSFIAISGGTSLNTMITTGTAWSATHLVTVSGFAVLSLLPPILKKYFEGSTKEE